MRLYLAGPMRPLPDNNFPLFERVTQQLRADGHQIISPHEFGDAADSRGKLMSDDIMVIVNECDGIICLPDWQNSPGASAEVAVAFATEKPVFDYVERAKTFAGEPYDLVPSKATHVRVPREEQYRAKTPLIGLCGYAQVGKDTVASLLISAGWERVAFADKLRDVLYAMNPIICDWPREGWFRVKNIVDSEGWDVAKTRYAEVRELLQRLGTEAGRENIDNNIWVGLGEDKIEAAFPNSVVVTDCRFQNELALIKRRKGTLVWIDRPGVAPANAHASEHSVSRSDCDVVLDNDGSIEDLAIKVKNLREMV